MMRNVLFLGFILMISSCNNSKLEPISDEESADFMILGDRISSEMQTVLLQNVSGAIQKGGTEYAVEFCNLEAMPLTDSISQKFDVKIQRLTDKNRNPKNAISSESDATAWGKIKTDKTDFISQNKQGDIYYYKPIMMGMPACIQCHGNRNNISEKTLELIDLKYPDDQAVDYELGDLRGMWKIKM